MSRLLTRMVSVRGSVLILAMWALVFLSALAIAVASHVDASIRVAGKMRNMAIGAGAARAGVERCMFEAAQDTNAWDSFDERWHSGEEICREVVLGEGVYSVYSVKYFLSGQAVTNYGLSDEESRVSVDKGSAELLAALMETAGGADHAAAVEIAACICDWRDADDDALTGGAEKSYYQGLEQSYSCHNAGFQAISELLLVKGMTDELFRKIERFITVYGSGRVNINTAAEPVLKSVCLAAGGDGAAADSLLGKVLKFRNAGGVFSAPVPAEITKQLKQFAGLTPPEEQALGRMMVMLTTQSSCFRGIAAGRQKDQAAGDGQSVEFVFDRQKGEKLYWYER